MNTATLTTVAVCPPWCTRHMTDPDGSIVHEGSPTTVTAAGDEKLVGGVIGLFLNRFDERGALGVTAACLTSSQDGIDLTAGELRQLAAAALNLADLIEVT